MFSLRHSRTEKKLFLNQPHRGSFCASSLALFQRTYKTNENKPLISQTLKRVTNDFVT